MCVLLVLLLLLLFFFFLGGGGGGGEVACFSAWFDFGSVWFDLVFVLRV